MVQLIRAILFDPELELRPEQIAKIAVIVPRQSKGDRRRSALIARGAVGSIESHLFTPEDHCPQTLYTADLPPGSALDRDSHDRCAGGASRT